MLYSSNKGKFRRELDALKKRMGLDDDELPSGLKLNTGLEFETPPAGPAPLRRVVMPSSR
ncbi:hypothetical protein BH20VER2_BH20VER2_14450 [soil metagenome]